jgi:microcystin-dependent protein
LELTGQAVSRTTYSGLFALLGTSYGAGDGTTTFNIPDYRGRTLVGHDASQTEFDVLGEAGGAKTHTLTTAEMPSHSHPTNLAERAYVTREFTGTPPYGDITGATKFFGSQNAVAPQGGDAGHNNLQPYTVVKWIICAASSSGNFDTEVQTALVTNVSSLQVGHRLVETLYITSSTTFAKAAYPWLRAIRFRVTGGGGAGGGCGAFSRSGGGGGGGATTSERFHTDISGMPASLIIQVAAGGAGSSNSTGGTGGASQVQLSTSIIASGGSGGVVPGQSVNEIGRGGQGGTSGSGDIVFFGQSGSLASSGPVFAFGGTGGSSGFGIGGGASQVSPNDNGSAAVGFGGGGSGGSNSASALARSGGAGAPGIVIIELYA